MKEIFIVEDDQDIRELLGFLLAGENYQIKSFASAQAFREGIVGQKPNLILMDTMLPDGNGLELCRELRQDESTISLPVVIMSAHSDLNISGESCAIDFIAKPFDVDGLLATIKKHVS
ncbi:MAG TPA: response regulator [Salinimicrobium sp.]|nr:response regulator [Salinimicrobium sp.]